MQVTEHHEIGSFESRGFDVMDLAKLDASLSLGLASLTFGYEQMGDCNYSSIMCFSIFTHFLHHRDYNSVVSRLDVLEALNSANVVWSDVWDAIDSNLGTAFLKLKRPLYNLIDLAGDVNIAGLSEPFDGLESIAGIMVPRNNQDWSNLAEFDDVFVTELLRIGAGAGKIEEVASDYNDINLFLFGHIHNLLQNNTLFTVQIVPIECSSDVPVGRVEEPHSITATTGRIVGI